MIVPLWYLVIWTSTTAAFASVCVAILAHRLLAVWPSLFAIGVNQVAFFCIARHFTYDYPRYVQAYFLDAGISAVLLAWLTLDIARSVPSSRWFPNGIRLWMVTSTFTVGVLVAMATMPDDPTLSLTYFHRFNRAAQYTLAAMAACLICSIVANRIGFSLTGFRITAGALIRQLSSLVFAHITAQHPPRNVMRAANTADTMISFCVALYWVFAILSNRRAERERREAWTAHAPQLETLHQ